MALVANGFKWTKALCETDSDGDGLTNGQELGDPCCTWQRGDAPSSYMASHAATHPGFATTNDSYVPPSCDAAEVRSPRAATPRARFNDGEEQRHLEWRLRDFQLPRKQTTYINVVFNIDEPEGVQKHDAYHIVYGEALVDQPHYLHHFVVKGCTEKIDASLAGKPLQDTPNGRPSPFLNNCEEQVGGFWAPGGRPMWDLATNQGVRIGKAANVLALSVNIHYTDGDKVNASSNVFPRDGIKMYYTPDLRPKTHLYTKLINIVGQANVLPRVGNQAVPSALAGITRNAPPAASTAILNVPAGKKRWYLTRRCTVVNRCKDASKKELLSLSGGRLGSCTMLCRTGTVQSRELCPETCGAPGGCTGGDKPLRVMDSFFHAHLLATEMYQSLIKHDTGAHIDLGSMRHWSYEDETAVPLDAKGVELVAGDVLSSTCVYNTQSMNTTTPFGRSTYDEMCLNTVGVELDTEDKHYGTAFSCEGAVWSGELGDHESALNIHASETLRATSSDCWTKIGNAMDCTTAHAQLVPRAAGPTCDTSDPEPALRGVCDVTLDKAGLLRMAWGVENTELVVRLRLARRAWVAIGLNRAGVAKMAGSYAIIGQTQSIDGKWDVSEYDLTSNSYGGVQKQPNAAQGLTDTTVTQTASRTELRFRRKLVSEDANDPPLRATAAVAGDTEMSDLVLYAYGAEGENALKYHAVRGATRVSWQSGNATREIYGAGLQGQSTLVHAHAVCMLLAWMAFAPTAVLAARFFKSRGGIKIHIALNISTVLMTGIGLVLILAAKINAGTATHFDHKHGQLGLAVVVLAVLQLISGIVRPKALVTHGLKDATQNQPAKRRLWEHWHTYFGSATLTCAMVNVLLGLRDSLGALGAAFNTLRISCTIVAATLLSVAAVCFVTLEARARSACGAISEPEDSIIAKPATRAKV
eukprot:g1200.t1